MSRSFQCHASKNVLCLDDGSSYAKGTGQKASFQRWIWCGGRRELTELVSAKEPEAARENEKATRPSTSTASTSLKNRTLSPFPRYCGSVRLGLRREAEARGGHDGPFFYWE